MAMVVLKPLLMLLVLLQLLGQSSASVASKRQAISLDGEWKFALHVPNYPDMPGFSNMSGVIKVPGCFEAQGFGNETVQMRWQVPTGDKVQGRKGAVGTYSKSVIVPSCVVGGKSVLMVDRGIHRHAVFKIAGQIVGEHTGYLTPFEADISSFVKRSAGSTVDIDIVLDGDRPCDKGGCSDPLMGASSLDTDNIGLGGWTGLNGHVSIECRPPIFVDGGVGNIIPPQVTYPPVTVASAGQPLTVSVTFVIGGASATEVRVHVLDNSTGAIVGSVKAASMLGNTTLRVVIPAVKLWSPENRSLYTAEVSIGPEDAPFDSTMTRFGVRTITVAGSKLMLNGQRIFLAGYGDDSIYPETISPPRDKATYEKKLKMAHDFGFNFVRHHSHVLPHEYFDAADEWGVMSSPELACAYGQYFTTANATGMDLYHKSWASYIASLRNHPSIFDWPLCNEMYMGAQKAQVFYDIKQELDPSRLMIDQDGACTGADKRNTNAFCSHQFDIGSMGAWGSIPLDEPNKYHDVCNATTHKCSFNPPGASIPVISHETGNYNTYPRLKSLIDKFASSGTTMKPFWLTGALQRLNASGLLAESEDWALASEKLYTLCWKIDVEDQRRNTEISGYEWWLLQDFWTGNNGIIDTFYRPKPGVAPYIGQFNARSIFLQDGLKFSYASKGMLTVDIILSNFGSSDLTSTAQVKWSVQLDGKVIKTVSAAVRQGVAQGDLGVIATVSMPLPDIGTTVSVPFGVTDGAKTITVSAELTAPISFAKSVPRNTWNATLFPVWVDSPTPSWKLSVVSPNPHGGNLLQGCGFSNCQFAPPSSDSAQCNYMANMDFPAEKSGGDIPVAGPDDCCKLCKLDRACKVAVFENTSGSDGICHIKTTLMNRTGVQKPGWIAALWGGVKPFPKGVYLTTYVDDSLLDAARHGSVVVLLQNASGASPLQTTPTRYKQAWWLGSATDNNAGTIVYKDAVTQKILGGMAPDGYADQSWYRMVNGAQTFLLDKESLPADWMISPPTVMMRAIDIVSLSRSKALLLSKSFGKGHIVATGLNCFQQCSRDTGCEYPEKAWVLDRLLRYAGSLLSTSGGDDPSSMVLLDAAASSQMRQALYV